MSDIQRFTPCVYPETDYSAPYVHYEYCDNGDCVLASEHDAEMERMRREKDALHDLFQKLADAKKAVHATRDNAAILTIGSDGWIVDKEVAAEVERLRKSLAIRNAECAAWRAFADGFEDIHLSSADAEGTKDSRGSCWESAWEESEQAIGEAEAATDADGGVA